jgi:hypothetical protein
MRKLVTLTCPSEGKTYFLSADRDCMLSACKSYADEDKLTTTTSLIEKGEDEVLSVVGK